MSEVKEKYCNSWYAKNRKFSILAKKTGKTIAEARRELGEMPELRPAHLFDAFYVRQNHFGKARFIAKHANRADIFATGETQMEAVANYLNFLNEVIKSESKLTA